MNEITIQSLSELTKDRQLEIAQLVENYTHGRIGEKPKMLAVTVDAVLKKHLVKVALGASDVFQGVIAGDTPELHEDQLMIETGMLWVPSTFRGKGTAHTLVKVATHALVLEGLKPYAFCNDKSLSIFEDSGYVQTTPCALPSVAFEYCKTQCDHKFKAGKCCDVQVIYDKGDEDE